MPHPLIRKMVGLGVSFSFVLLSAVSSFAGTINYYYDAVDRVKYVQYPDGKVITYIYDNVGNRKTKIVTTGFPSFSITFDKDGRTDIGIWRPSTGYWWILGSMDNAEVTFPWGSPTDIVVPGDYDGDGIVDYAIWRPSTGQWWIYRSSDNAVSAFAWGSPGDVPVKSLY